MSNSSSNNLNTTNNIYSSNINSINNNNINYQNVNSNSNNINGISSSGSSIGGINNNNNNNNNSSLLSSSTSSLSSLTLINNSLSSINLTNNLTNSNNNNNNNKDTTPKIIDAARKGNTDLINKYLKKDWKKINKRDEKGDTCLHKAAMFGQSEAIESILRFAQNNNLLSSNQVNVNIKNYEGYTPFMYSVLNNCKECMKILHSYGADVNEKLPTNPGIPMSYSVTNSTGAYTWKIENFSKIKERKIQSSTFLVSGHSWKLVAYPHGSKSDDNFSLYLEVANYESLADGWSHLANFTFTIHNHLDSSKKVTRDVVGHRFHRNHTDLGYSQILKKEMLKDKKSGFLLNDTLLVDFKIEVLHNSTYQNEETSIYTWKIQNVSYMKERATSPVFKVGNCKWTIALYPKGKNGGNNLSIYLKVADKSSLPPDWFFLVSFKFSLIDQKNGTKFTRQVEGKRFKENVEDWGFPQFMKLSSLYDSNLNSSGFLKTVDDSIIIELQMEIINDFTRKKVRETVNDWSLSSLHISAYRNSHDAVRLLLVKGANPNITDSKGRTPLDWCAYNGDLPTAEVLITVGGADINCKDNEGYTPLHKAVLNGHIEVARLLVKHGANVNDKNHLKVTPLELAIRVNRIWCVEILIQWGADLNVVDKYGRSPLHWAIYLGDPKLLAILIKYGCSDKNIEKKSNQQLQQQQVQLSQKQSNKILRSGELINSNDEVSFSSNNEDDSVCDNPNNLVDSQLDQNESNNTSSNNSPTQPSILNNSLNNNNNIVNTTSTTTTNKSNINNNELANQTIANFLNLLTNPPNEVKKSVTPLKINIIDNDGFTPLHKAIIKGKASFVKILLEKGADPTIVTKDNRNALHLAVSVNEYYIVQLILDFCDQPDKLFTFDDINQTPLHKSVINGNMKLLELLIQRGASINCNVFTPAINEAIKNNDILCTIFLVQNSAEIHKSPKLLMSLVTKRLRYLNNYNIESQIPPCSLGRDMLYLVNNPEYKDVTFIVEGRPIYAWKGILCARSDYFRAMFEVPLSESIKGEVQMESISHSTFLLVLQYLYTGEVIGSKLTNPTINSKIPLIEADDGTSRKPNNHHIQPNNLGFEDYIQLFIAANRFMINRLKLVVETLIIKEYSIYNIYSIFKLTDIYESTFLLNEAIKFLCDNHTQIAETNIILKMNSFRKALLDILNTSLRNKSFPFLESNNYNNNNNTNNNNVNINNNNNNYNIHNNNSNNSNSDSDDNTNDDGFFEEEDFNPNNYNYANNYIYASNINSDDI